MPEQDLISLIKEIKLKLNLISLFVVLFVAQNTPYSFTRRRDYPEQGDKLCG